MRYVGVDLHKTQFSVYWRSEDKEEGEFDRHPMTHEGMRRFREKLDGKTEVALEATGNSKYFYDQVVGVAKKVRLINPLQFKSISESVKKTDKEDARVIAKYSSKGLIPEVRVMGKELRELKSLIQTWDKLVKIWSSLKHKIQGILTEHVIQSRREMFSSVKTLEEVLKAPVSEMSRFELEVIVKQIKSLTEGIKDLEGMLKGKGKGLKGQKNLQSITGIGKLSSTIILSKIGNINDFASKKKLGAYVGLVPRVYESNETVRHGRITKRGDKILRTTLVQVTLIAIKYNEYLRSFYLRLREKKGSGKAIIATARKMLEIIYDTLKNDWVFEDFNNFVLA